MELTNLPGSNLQVSRVCFGTMTFGSQVDEPTAMRMVERCLDEGVNFFDTANVYNKGASEQMLGKALTGRRHRVVLASKVRGKMGDGADEQGLSPAAIRRAIDESLRRLGTDYLDIYYLHQPDYDVPIEETLQVMDELVRGGKVRYAASSNYSSWQVCQMLWIAEKNSWAAPLISQPMYNLLARGIEQEFLPMAHALGVGTVVYNPLAGGLLTGKHRRIGPVSGSRFDKNKMYLDRYWHDDCFDAVEELKRAAGEEMRSLISLALNWLLHHTPIDCVILGASRIEQLEENLRVLKDGPLSERTLAICDILWQGLRGPVPPYNR